MARFFLAAFLFFAGSFSTVAFAYPATLTGYVYSQTLSGFNSQSSPQAVCDVVLAAHLSANPGSTEGRTYNVTESGCSISFKWSNRTWDHLVTIYKIPQYICSSGGSLVGSECVFPVGEEDLADYCSQFSGNSRDASVSQPGRGTSGPNIGFTNTCRVPEAYDPDGGDSGIPMFPDTDKGCGAAFEYSWAASDGNGNWTVFGRETYSGGICTPGSGGGSEPGAPPGGDDNVPSKDPDKSCDGYQGTVNGVSTCVPFAEKTGTDGTAKKTNPDGSSEETTTKTDCTATKCTTTSTTTTKDSAGNVTGITVNVGDSTKNVYCNKNPKAAICAGEGAVEDGGQFGGSCVAGFSCKGDVLQCVIAKEQHKRACQLVDDANDETRLYDASKAKTGDQTTDLPGNRVLDMGAPGMFKTDALFGSGSCISNLSIQVMSRTVELPMSYLCPWVAELRYVLLGLSGLYWVLIVFGRR